MQAARFLNALLIYILTMVLLSALVIQYGFSEQPCPLCLLQRLGMIGMATGALLNLRFDFCAQHYALTIFYAISGGAVALRQILLHICPSFSTFGKPLLGLSLYTWSFLVSVSAVLYIALIFLALPSHLVANASKEVTDKTTMNFFEKGAAFLLLFVTAANLFSTYTLCGWGRCPS